MTEPSLLSYLAQSCAYAQEHIDDLDAWPSDYVGRERLLQCTSYQVACFIAQNTNKGSSGVSSDIVLAELIQHPAKPASEWEAIIQDIVDDHGGLTQQEAPTSQPTKILLANDKFVYVDDCGYGTVKCSLGLRELIGVGQKGLIQILSLAGTGSPNIIDAVYRVTHTAGDRIHFQLTGNLNQCR